MHAPHTSSRQWSKRGNHNTQFHPERRIGGTKNHQTIATLKSCWASVATAHFSRTGEWTDYPNCSSWLCSMGPLNFPLSFLTPYEDNIESPLHSRKAFSVCSLFEEVWSLRDHVKSWIFTDYFNPGWGSLGHITSKFKLTFYTFDSLQLQFKELHSWFFRLASVFLKT